MSAHRDQITAISHKHLGRIVHDLILTDTKKNISKIKSIFLRRWKKHTPFMINAKSNSLGAKYFVKKKKKRNVTWY